MIFPEGTDKSIENTKKSDLYAETNKLNKFKEVLHPKVKGFQSILMLLNKNIESVYDITIGYPDIIPQNESYLVKGVTPSTIHFHVKQYNVK